jgi:hypothetical protein
MMGCNKSNEYVDPLHITSKDAAMIGRRLAVMAHVSSKFLLVRGAR